jgi:hypothetical protein
MIQDNIDTGVENATVTIGEETFHAFDINKFVDSALVVCRKAVHEMFDPYIKDFVTRLSLQDIPTLQVYDEPNRWTTGALWWKKEHEAPKVAPTDQTSLSERKNKHIITDAMVVRGIGSQVCIRYTVLSHYVWAVHSNTPGSATAAAVLNTRILQGIVPENWRVTNEGFSAVLDPELEKIAGPSSFWRSSSYSPYPLCKHYVFSPMFESARTIELDSFEDRAEMARAGMCYVRAMEAVAVALAFQDISPLIENIKEIFSDTPLTIVDGAVVEMSEVLKISTFRHGYTDALLALIKMIREQLDADDLKGHEALDKFQATLVMAIEAPPVKQLYWFGPDQAQLAGRTSSFEAIPLVLLFKGNAFS